MFEYDSIAKSQQKDVISSFWLMLKELETVAINNNDAVLYVQVEGWFRQWNAMTHDTQKPRWMST